MPTEEQQTASLLEAKDVTQIADTHGAGLLTDDEGLRELRLLYNHADDDSRQFTRWQMITAMSHGYALARDTKDVTIAELRREVERWQSNYDNMELDRTLWRARAEGFALNHKWDKAWWAITGLAIGLLLGVGL